MERVIWYGDVMCSQSPPSSYRSCSSDALDREVQPLPRYVSFILRCQITAHRLVRVRLLDTRSGLSRSVDDLGALPKLIDGWLRQDQD